MRLRFVTSASDYRQLPATTAEVAVVGRSNVGKSSLINALAGQRQLARVSKTPGRTQLLNLFEMDHGATLVDMPGYGYAKAPQHVRQRWAHMSEQYLLHRENLMLLLVLIDGEVGPTALDLSMLEWVRHYDLPIAIIATKHDKVRSAARTKRKREFVERCQVEPKEVTWVSASTRVGIDQLRDLLLGALTI